MSDGATRSPGLAPGLSLFLLLALSLTAVRVVGLHLSVVDFYVDESQYWAWSQHFAFGYFSKPPLIAWLIALGNGVCGSGEACLRSTSALAYLGTSLLIYWTAAELYDRRIAFWAGLTAILAPGIVFSARIVSTDVPLLFFWALALLAFAKLSRGGSPLWALGLAAGIGLGLLSKYAMIYFLPGMALAALIDRDARALLRRPLLWLSTAAGLAFLIPNFLWNAGHGFITFHHVGENAGGGHFTFHPGTVLEFLGAQFGVAGPIVFGTLLVLFWRLGRRTPPPDGMLIAFAIPPLAIITALAFVSNANINWAATAFVSAFVVVPAAILREGRRWLLVVGLAVGLVVQATLLITDSMADRVSVPFLARGDIYHRSMGWRDFAEATGAIANKEGAGALVAASRANVAALIYYLHDIPPVFAWPSATGIPGDHFQMSRPLTAAAPHPILMVRDCASPDSATDQPPLARFTVKSGPHMRRHYAIFRLPDGPLPAAPPHC